MSERCSITYKGPKTDATSKTRQELDIPMGPVDPNGERFHALLSALGFLVVISVHKSRQEARFQYAGRDYAVCLDRARSLVGSPKSKRSPVRRMCQTPWQHSIR